MKPAIFSGYLVKKRGGGRRTPDECMKMCAEAGFRTVDWSPDYSCASWQDEAKAAAVAAEKYGIEIIQSHTPYNFYARAPLEDFKKQLGESVEAAKLLGVRDLVFHFDEYHPAPGCAFDSNQAMDTIYEIMAPYIEKTVGYGINAALETIIEDHIRVSQNERSHYGGDFDELVASIEKFNDERVTCCWDFGHAELNYGDEHIEKLRLMGKKISCTHVHDNYYGKDLHLLPFLGNLRWETLIAALKSTGYDGALTFEVGYGSIPDLLIGEFLKLSFDTMNLMCNL